MVNTDGTRTIADGAGDTRVALTPHGFARKLTPQEEAQARTPLPDVAIFAPKSVATPSDNDTEVAWLRQRGRL
jgi:hypothetical protein